MVRWGIFLLLPLSLLDRTARARLLVRRMFALFVARTRRGLVLSVVLFQFKWPKLPVTMATTTTLIPVTLVTLITLVTLAMQTTRAARATITATATATLMRMMKKIPRTRTTPTPTTVTNAALLISLHNHLAIVNERGLRSMEHEKTWT